MRDANAIKRLEKVSYEYLCDACFGKASRALCHDFAVAWNEARAAFGKRRAEDAFFFAKRMYWTLRDDGADPADMPSWSEITMHSFKKDRLIE